MKKQKQCEKNALKQISVMAFDSIDARLKYVELSSAKSKVWEINDGAYELSSRLTWAELSDALKCFCDFVPILCNAEVGKSGVSVSDPQEHRLAEALSKACAPLSTNLGLGFVVGGDQ